ncbi:MAG TPA: Fic family protein [Gemmatimonadales bacterium]|mgnify:CR=1 FL=1|nr:Fic family protein [Gemmatimonadales bacterium]
MRDYPHLLFRRHWEITGKARYELGQCDAIIQAISNTPLLPAYHSQLLGVSLSKGAQATTAIEGNTLTEEEVQAVAAGHSLPASKEYQEIEVRNILEAYNALLQDVAANDHVETISRELLLRFHAMIGKGLGEHFDAVPGQFRKDDRTVGPYRTPAHQDVEELVGRLCEWLRREFRFGADQTFAEAVTQAIVTHVYIEWIHPFGDGNGRTGRLVEFYILLRAGNPDIASHILSNFYNETRSEYYRQIDLAFRKQDLSGFIEYAVQGFRDGLLRTLKTIQGSQFEITWRKLIYDRFAEKKYTKKTVYNRQRLLALTLPMDASLPEAQILSLSPEVGRAYAVLSPRTLRRDLDELIQMGIVVQVDGKYRANGAILRMQVPQRRRSSVKFGGAG